MTRGRPESTPSPAVPQHRTPHRRGLQETPGKGARLSGGQKQTVARPGPESCTVPPPWPDVPTRHSEERRRVWGRQHSCRRRPQGADARDRITARLGRRSDPPEQGSTPGPTDLGQGPSCSAPRTDILGVAPTPGCSHGHRDGAPPPPTLPPPTPLPATLPWGQATGGHTHGQFAATSGSRKRAWQAVG